MGPFDAMFSGSSREKGLMYIVHVTFALTTQRAAQLKSIHVHMIGLYLKIDFCTLHLRQISSDTFPEVNHYEKNLHMHC